MSATVRKKTLTGRPLHFWWKRQSVCRPARRLTSRAGQDWNATTTCFSGCAPTPDLDTPEVCAPHSRRASPSYRCRVGQAGRLPGTKDLQNEPRVQRFLRRFRSRRERKIFNAASQLAVRCYAFSGLRPKKWPFGAAGMKFPCKCGEVSLPYTTGGDAR